MVLDPEKEFAAREEFEKEQAAKYQGMESLIRASGEKFLVLEHNGVKIRIRTALPPSIKREILKFIRKYKGIDLEKVKRGDVDIANLPEGFIEDNTSHIYRGLASICLDAPYNEPGAWEYYDNQTGEAQLIFEEAQTLMEEAHQTAISFLKKRAGTGDS
ncbi:hypothetical protein [Methanoregula sp.]|jgi:hypothetical protein|uniref:hypothetical protein n=1 Tax=Methanoregula sp. TaxID=2052170 RepID=UPI0035630E82